jgi:hypothetical protein
LWSQPVFISHSHEMMVVQAEGPYRKLVTRLLEGGIIKLLIERMFDTASTVSAPQPTVDQKTCCMLTTLPSPPCYVSTGAPSCRWDTEVRNILRAHDLCRSIYHSMQSVAVTPRL